MPVLTMRLGSEGAKLHLDPHMERPMIITIVPQDSLQASCRQSQAEAQLIAAPVSEACWQGRRSEQGTVRRLRCDSQRI